MFDGAWYTPDRKAIYEAARERSLAVGALRKAEEELTGAYVAAWAAFAWRRTATLLLVVGIVVAGWLALVTPVNSYQQSLFIEIAAGIATFMVLPWALAIAGTRPTRFFVGGTLITAISGAAGYIAPGVVQALLIEIAVASAFVMLLEVFFQRFYKNLVVRYQDATQKLQDVRSRMNDAQATMANAQSVLDWENAATDFLGIPRFEDFGGIQLPPEEVQS